VSEKDHTVDDKDAEAAVDRDTIHAHPEAADTEVADADDTQVGDDAETDDAAPDIAADDDGGRTTGKRSRRSVRSLVSAVVLAVALLASGGLAGWLYVNEYRTDQETDPAATQVALDAAKTGTIALLSYSPESLDQDFANAKSKLTGDFLNYYTQFTEQIVTPAAREKSVKTAASVVRAAVSQMEPDNAEVLVFINQTTTSKENPDGAFAASSVKVGLTKIDGTWLIESFDPV
jgi:Mce-associated membrane protein